MRYEIELTKDAKKEFLELSTENKTLLIDDYKTVQEQGNEFVRTRPIEDKTFEIKTKNIRSLFIYRENQIIIIGLIYIKKTQKMPNNIKKQANKRFKHV